MTMDTETREVVRIGDDLIDPETGEILEGATDLDSLTQKLVDAQQQIKAWEQAVAIYKSAAGRVLDEMGVKKAETPFGTPSWRSQVRRSATRDRFDHVVGEFGLTEQEQTDILLCANGFDPKALDEVRASGEREQLARAIDALIEIKTISFVVVQPLRRAAPRMTTETVEAA